MNEHTKGRLEAFTQESFSGWYALRDQRHFEVGSGDGGFDEADARRLAACWNACVGLSTEDLESLPCAFSEVAVGDWMHNGKELTAARALLREVRGLIDENAQECDSRGLKAYEHPIHGRIRNYLDACDTLGSGHG